MAFVKPVPSLPLFASADDRKFSHVTLDVLSKDDQSDQFPTINISRDIFTQSDIDDIYEDDGKITKSRKICPPIKCGLKTLCTILSYYLPIISVLRHYSEDWRGKLIGDIMAGISVACLHFPQGLAYGILASLTPVEGLYSSFFPVLFYTIFGTSQHMSFATDSVIAIFTAEVIDSQVKSDFYPRFNTTSSISDHELLSYKVSVSAGCTFVCGAILVTMGIFRMGFLTTLQSKSFIGGFTTAAAFHIFTSQIHKAFGIEIPLVKGVGKLVYTFMYIFEQLKNSNVASIVIVIICVIFIIFLKDFINIKYKVKLRVPLPADLMTIILATIISYFAKLEQNYDIEVVGSIPPGIPEPHLPNLNIFVSIFPQCIQMTCIIFFLSIAMAKVNAEHHEYEVNDTKELMAYGLTNLGCSFFPCYPASVSPPRNMILSSMGSRTTLNGAFTSCVMILVLYLLSQLFSALPVSALAAMIFVSVKPLLLQVRTLPKLFRVNKYDFIIWMCTCLSGILLDLPYGLIVGIAVSIITIIVQGQWSEVITKRRDSHRVFIKTSKSDKENGEKVLVFQMYASLYFATSERFRKHLYTMTVNPLKETRHSDVTTRHSDVTNVLDHSLASETSIGSESYRSCTTHTETDKNNTEHRVKVIIIDCSGMTYIDIQGINTLSVVFEEYRRVGIAVYLAGCTPYVWKSLKASDFFNFVSKERIFYQIQDAYQAASEILT
ncbi:hypothetical protein ACF0H5_000683 [Mactra antiquata]